MVGGKARWMSAVLAIACLISAGGAYGQEPAKPKQTITLPAIAPAAQGGGEVKKVQPSKPADPLAQGYIHFWYTPKHWLEWTFDSASAGEYQVSLHYSTKYPVQRLFKINGEVVNASKAAEQTGIFTLAPTGRWNDWKDVTLPATAMLKQGKNVLRISCLDDCSVMLSEIRLTAAGKEPVVIAAARFTGQGGGAVQVLTPPAAGYVRDWSAKGHWLEWTVDSAAAGAYDIYLHYATDQWCPREMQVNGEVVKGLESFAMETTGDDRNWCEAKLPVTVTLKQGRNVLRMTSLAAGELGLASVRLVSPPVKAAAGETALAKAADTQPSARANYAAVPFAKASLGPALPAVPGAAELKAGQELRLGALKAIVKKFDALPYVQNEYSSRFVYELAENPQLAQIRQMYKLDEVVAAGKDEFEKQLLLMEWVYNQWDFGHAQERYDLVDPFEILQYARREHKFQCMHSSAVFQTLANSMGWVSRKMCIPQHTFNEVWSNQYRRWVMFDATSNYTPERAGLPLDTYELRQALLYENGKDVVSLRHKDGNFTQTPKDPKYGQRLLFLGYIPNTNCLVSGPDYTGMFIIKDKLCEGKKWHTRDCPKDPAHEPYFPIGQAALALVPGDAGIGVTIGTMTPNFREFQVRLDGGQWKASGPTFTWSLHKGPNKLEARSMNKFDVAGPVSTVELDAE
jgi:hypothetical protein